ncbi:MAG: bifunctional folylpolyglutamate synthase/dihydrofolate synthase [Deltaproteobacteria bacterium]|jgi:dihydrofolate synthase/folylpolyglutamate synthase|nr:bifunctional folylpolyglutamate synthase/dihydrofolate synthase [Deltaproteobacteria bacterium]
MAYKDTISSIFELQKFGMKFGLDSMRGILSRLGNPEAGGRYVHLAGTNGKGSTAAMIEAVLREAGYRTGLYTSPHLVTFRERIRVDGGLMPEEEVEEIAAEVWKGCLPGRPPTFFEFVTAMAFLRFRRAGTDLAVLEAGLGGRLDSTNVVEPLVAAITNIGLEHTEHLGGTIAEIAAEKAGIIKPGAGFAAGRLVPEAARVIGARLDGLGAAGRFLGRDFTARTVSEEAGRPVIDYRGPSWSLDGVAVGLAGPYQADNAALAIAVLELLSEMPSPGGEGRLFALPEECLRRGLAGVSWPGRGEIFAPGLWPPGRNGRAPLLLDGAHNPDGARSFAEYLRRIPRRELHLIVGVMADKDVAGVLGPVIAEADRLYLTRPVYSRAAAPELLLERLRGASGEPGIPWELYPELPGAIEAAARQAGPEDVVVVSGSLFTVGEARAYLTGESIVESN